VDSLQIIILSIVQGLTEFLPISSSAHLVLLPQIFGWADQGLVFDVALHFGSLIAVLYYFRDEVRRMLKSWSRSLSGGDSDQDSLLAWWVIIGTLPATFVGFLLQGPIEEKLREPWILATASIVFGLLLWFADANARRNRDEYQFNGCADHRLLPGAGADSRHLAFRHHDHAGALSWANPQSRGAIFLPVGNAGNFRQRRVAVGAHG